MAEVGDHAFSCGCKIAYALYKFPGLVPMQVSASFNVHKEQQTGTSAFWACKLK